jgi:hypothetical protein
MLLVAVVDDVKIIVINIIAEKDIGDESQERRLSDTNLSEKKNGVWLICVVL